MTSGNRETERRCAACGHLSDHHMAAPLGCYCRCVAVQAPPPAEGETERQVPEDETNRLMREHWLLIDLRSGQSWVTGCHCGFKADLDSDCGYGDSVVRHLVDEALAAGRASAAAGEVHVEWGVRWNSDENDVDEWSEVVARSMARDISEGAELVSRTVTTTAWQPVEGEQR